MRYVGQIFSGAAALGGVTLGLGAFALINGGYVYKTTCPLASGGSQTSWTYAIVDILPYIRRTKEPCHSHTSTRLALSGIGIWPLGHSTTKARATTAGDREAVESLRVATAEITTEYARERRLSAAFTKEAKAKGFTPAIRQKLIRLLKDTRGALQAIKDKLDRPIKASDSQLLDTRAALSEWIGYQVAVDDLFFSSSSPQDWLNRGEKQYGSKLNDVVARLHYLSVTIQARFPQVKDWSFLPAK